MEPSSIREPTGIREASGSIATKRKRSLSVDAPMQPAPPLKVAKTQSNHLQINYLSRHFEDTLPLIAPEDPLPSLLSLMADYDGVLQRHESMAGNLGARPLGPILIKRFERLFDGPPRVLKTHGKEGTTVGWLDVVDFARNKPEQFNLEKTRDGVRVCQFYTKQSRVEITEEDYVLIASGMPQKLIPPQPIVEDEEKELGTLEILEKNLGQVVILADQVSARARQLNHRLKNRKNAIISRREAEAPTGEEHSAARSPTKSGHARVADMGPSSHSTTNGESRSSASPSSGFVAVNARHALPHDGPPHDGIAPDSARMANVTVVNGTSLHGASATTRAELLGKFLLTTKERAASMDHDRSTTSVGRASGTPKSRSKPTSEPADPAALLLQSASPVPIPTTPCALLPYAKPTAAERFDDSGPYKAEMVTRMEQLQRGDRIQPPCDRCRRLHMDCLKNLTACMGCTKKHAKCAWKDVTDDELRENPYLPHHLSPDDTGLDASSDPDAHQNHPIPTSETLPRRGYPRDHRQGVPDEELLGEEASSSSPSSSPSSSDEHDDEARRPTQQQQQKQHQHPSEPIPAATRFPPAMTTPPPSHTDADAARESDADTVQSQNRGAATTKPFDDDDDGETVPRARVDKDTPDPESEAEANHRHPSSDAISAAKTLRNAQPPHPNGTDPSEIHAVYAPTAKGSMAGVDK